MFELLTKIISLIMIVTLEVYFFTAGVVFLRKNDYKGFLLILINTTSIPIIIYMLYNLGGRA